MEHAINISGPEPIPIQTHSVEIETLLRELLEHLDAQGSTEEMPEDGPGAHTVLLDISVDGITYRLLRSNSAHPMQRVALSPREQEIVRLVAKGLPNKAIADVLDMSLWTVGTHMRRVFAKLGVGTRAEMIARVLDEGLLPRNSDHAPV
jgi:DNA-binding CsgD family transcriptional regulator